MSENNTDFTLGELLQKKRSELKISIGESASYLRVKPRDIDAIESNKFDAIGKHIYLLGFVRSYAKFLKIDSQLVEKKIKSVSVRSNVDNKEHKLVNIGEHIDLVPEKDMFFNFLLISALLFFVFLSLLNSYENSDSLLSTKVMIDEMKKMIP